MDVVPGLVPDEGRREVGEAGCQGPARRLQFSDLAVVAIDDLQHAPMEEHVQPIAVRTFGSMQSAVVHAPLVVDRDPAERRGDVRAHFRSHHFRGADDAAQHRHLRADVREQFAQFADRVGIAVDEAKALEQAAVQDAQGCEVRLDRHRLAGQQATGQRDRDGRRPRTLLTLKQIPLAKGKNRVKIVPAGD